MKFIADLHVHSKFSRATAKNLDLEHMHISAQLKGITVIGTGDFTHPQWFSEIKEKLIPAESGLFKLKDDIARHCDQEVPESCRGDVRFVLESEISNIYKKDGKTRKNHNLIYLPDLETAAKFNQSLDKIGNIKSDGRPILGLDARNLLEILLETNPDGFLVPAHIWTPWFSVLGSKSGFDSLRECFEDLSDHIFAAETGLSSDPAMNWRVSDLDHITLISNSDAHSPSKLGREANLFNTELSYFAIKSAIRSGDAKQFPGTLEFYPEEGKYHLDGHRKCGVRLSPDQTKKRNGICPECGKPLTLGVLYRVEELSDRNEEEKPSKARPFHHIIPLPELLSEIFQVGVGSKKVNHHLNRLLQKLGPELKILHFMDIASIKDAGLFILAEAVERMRHKKVSLSPGYDGEFGRIKVFNADETERFKKQKKLFEDDFNQVNKGVISSFMGKQEKDTAFKSREGDGKKTAESPTLLDSVQFKNKPTSIDHHKLNQDQQKAVNHESDPLIIDAGPGTGKTRTLTHRIAHLISNKKINPQDILAVTFTNKAAEEMGQRIVKLLGSDQDLPLTATFHSLCLKILTDNNRMSDFSIIDDDEQKYILNRAIHASVYNPKAHDIQPKKIINIILLAKQQMVDPDDVDYFKNQDRLWPVIQNVYRKYQHLLAVQGIMDYEDLIIETIRLFELDPLVLQGYQKRYQHILIDEYQDLNPVQYRLVRLLSPAGKNLFVIGDPNQSIYGFRGSDLVFFNRFIQDFPNSKRIQLRQNYRSTQSILDAGFQVIIDKHRSDDDTIKIFSNIQGTQTLGIMEAGTEKAEAVAVGKQIENLVGGMGFYSIDYGKTGIRDGKDAYAFSDFAILFRTRRQAQVMLEVLEDAGIPCQLVGRSNPLNEKGINPVMAMLKIVEGSGSYYDLVKLVRQGIIGIGKKTLDRFITWGIEKGFSLPEALRQIHRHPIRGIQAERQRKLCDLATRMRTIEKSTANMSLNERVDHIIDQAKDLLNSKHKDFAETLQERFGQLLNQYKDKSRDVFFSRIALQSDTDEYDSRVEKVSLMTMHTSKGLEFPVVFITGCEDGLIPYHRPEQTANNPEEERRLFYVAMTRAGERLYLTYSKNRNIHGVSKTMIPSPYIDDIENRLKNTISQKKRKKSTPRGPVQMDLF